MIGKFSAIVTPVKMTKLGQNKLSFSCGGKMGAFPEPHLILGNFFLDTGLLVEPLHSESFIPLTWVASIPLSDDLLTNSTTSFSPKLLNPVILITLWKNFNNNNNNNCDCFHWRVNSVSSFTWCTKTSDVPSSGVMNPQPLATLNHLQRPLRFSGKYDNSFEVPSGPDDEPPSGKK